MDSFTSVAGGELVKIGRSFTAWTVTYTVIVSLNSASETTMEKLSSPLKSGNGVYVTVGVKPSPVTETVPFVSFASTLQLKSPKGRVSSLTEIIEDITKELLSSSFTVAVVSLASTPSIRMVGGKLIGATTIEKFCSAERLVSSVTLRVT